MSARLRGRSLRGSAMAMGCRGVGGSSHFDLLPDGEGGSIEVSGSKDSCVEWNLGVLVHHLMTGGITLRRTSSARMSASATA